MIVCHCRRVCDRTIRAAVQAGADTEEAVSKACGAGSVCGGCIPAVTELLDEEQEARDRAQVITTAA
jgi:bacterioferritin-associated ferredoxin